MTRASNVRIARRTHRRFTQRALRDAFQPTNDGYRDYLQALDKWKAEAHQWAFDKYPPEIQEHFREVPPEQATIEVEELTYARMVKPPPNPKDYK